MKICPYCEGEVANNAKKCKYCGEVLIEEKKVRLCPYCGSEISETAKKCKNCGEWIDESDGSEMTKDGNTNNKKTTISLGNVLKTILIIGVFVEFCSFLLSCVLYNSGTNDSIENIIGFLAIPALLVLIIGFIVTIVRSVRNYKILLSSGATDLHFDSASKVGWGWIIPIVSLYRPCQAVKDILRNFELSKGKKSNCSIVGWWWAMFILGIFFSRGYISMASDAEKLLMLDIVTSLFSALEYFFLIKIIERVNKAQE